MKKTTRFFLMLAALALPLAILLASYACYDPFMVLRTYTDYNADQGVDLNRDFVSTQVYLNQAHTQNYDSFIFGSSRSHAFMTMDWSPYIGSRAAFHFDSWFETVYGVAGKIRLIDRNGSSIKHVLLVLDSNLLAGTTDREGLIQMKHPATSGREFAFHALCVKSYLSHRFLFPFLGRKVLGIASPPMRDSEGKPKVTISTIGNDYIRVGLDARMAADEDAYYAGMEGIFGDQSKRHETIDTPVIGPESLAMLREIRAICTKQGTDIRIVVSPLFDQCRLNPVDLAILSDLFGADHVNDFSGANEITNDVRNYYELSHYRRHVGQALLKRIYQNGGK